MLRTYNFDHLVLYLAAVIFYFISVVGVRNDMGKLKKNKIEFPIASEFEEQVMLVQYLELLGLKFSKLAQETYTPSWMIKAKNKASGLRRGIPDMLVVIPETKETKKRLLFIEMKRSKGGKVSPEQEEWLDILNSCFGVEAIVCHGFEEAKKEIDKRLIK